MSLLALQHGIRDWLTMEADGVASRCVGHGEAGLRVYINTYRAQLMACLSGSYATVHAWLGDTAFEAAAATHIDRVPPSSWTLDAYALDFPETVDALYPNDPEVGEIARLERALGLLFTAPDHAPVDTTGLAKIDWDNAVFRFAPCLRLLPTTTNAGAVWSAIAHGHAPPAAEMLPTPTGTLVWRDGFTPAFRTLDKDETVVLNRLLRGESFGAVCAHLVHAKGDDKGQELAGTYLGQWLHDRIVVEIFE